MLPKENAEKTKPYVKFKILELDTFGNDKLNVSYTAFCSLFYLLGDIKPSMC